MEALGGRPDTTADYGRIAALPVVQGPAGVTDPGRWFAAAGATAGPLVWDQNEREDDPRSQTERLFRGLEIGTATHIVLPNDTPDRDVAGKKSGGDLLPEILEEEWGSVTCDRLSMREDESPAEFDARTSGRLVWDARSRLASPLPVPFHPDEGIVVAWGTPRDTGGLIPSDLPGSLAESPPPLPHLLATSAASGGGELDPTLLRSPVTGVVRFERYHHVVRAESGELTLRRPSRDGRLVVLSSPLASVDRTGLTDAFDDVAEIDRQLYLAFEDVQADSLLDVLPAVVMDQVRRFDALLESGPFTGGLGDIGRYLRETIVWLLRTWQAAAELDWLLALVPSSVAGTLRDLVPRGWMPNARDGDAAIRAAVTIIVAHGDALFQLKEFVRDVFARLLLGDTWADLGITIDPADAVPGTAAKEAVDFAALCERWIPCFAGCPLGRPGWAWVQDEIASVAWDAGEQRFTGDAGTLQRVLFSTFQVEAFYQARLGGDGDPISDHQQARADGAVAESELRDWGLSTVGQILGSKSILRLVEFERPKRPFTTLDWIREVARGTVRRRYQLPLLDFEPDALAAHPLSELIEWDLFTRARAVRDGTDGLEAEAVHGRTLSWWVSHTRLADGAGKWPSMFSPERQPPGPRTPYRLAGSAASGRNRAVTQGPWQHVLSSAPGLPSSLSLARSGWDDFDFLAVAKAAAAVRDGRTLQAPVHPALVLAVAETEGYRVFAPQGRVRDVQADRGRREDGASFSWAPPPAQAAAELARGAVSAQTYADEVSVSNWWLHPHELDIMVFPRKHELHPGLVEESRWVIDRLLRIDWDGLPGDPAPDDPVDPDRSLIDPGFLPSGDVYAFVDERITAEWSQLNGVDLVRSFRLTRSMQWVGLAVQAAIFQWVHRQLHEMTGYLPGEVYRRIDELVDPASPAPSPGVDALDPARKDYIAYWATVYLAFNASPKIWNDWVDVVHARRTPTERATNYLLYRLNNSASTPPNRAKYGTLGHMTRFAVALDAFLRVDFESGAFDAQDPGRRAWP